MKKILLFLLVIVTLIGCENKEITNNELTLLKEELANSKDTYKALESEKIELENKLKESNEKIIDLEEKLDLEYQKKDIVNNTSRNSSNFLVIAKGKNDFRYIINSQEESSYSYTLNIVSVGSSETLLFDEFEYVNLDGPGQGETLKVQVLGDIYNFEIIEVIWSEAENDLVESNIVESIDKISNKILMIDTYLNCGIPSAKLKWENKDGEIFEYYLSQDGYGFSGQIINCE